MQEKDTIFRKIPQVEKILQTEEISKFIPVIGHSIVVKIIRKEIDLFREKLLKNEAIDIDELFSSIKKSCTVKKLERIQRVINGTGVIIHTNLGRAPISSTIFDNLKNTLSGYCNLELHLPTEKRGKRGGYVEELLCELTSAEDALIVNNNASSVFLILNQFAKDKEVIISRGELIQIGGGFRIPDILKQSGAHLVEVGTTNITTIDDFKNAVSQNTAMILSAHQSNYKIEGFTSSPSLKELAGLKSESIIFVRDLGSGNLVNNQELPQPFEPVVNSELAQGADLICFSGDKLLGCCQAGIIIGKKELISRLRKHPLMRILRVDKITYYILQETLLHYVNGQVDDIALWNIIFQKKENVSNRINRLLKKIKNPSSKIVIEKVPTRATFGGGTLPTVEIDSYGIQINISGIKGDTLYTHFLNEDVPIIGTIINDTFTLDFLTVLDKDIPYIVSAIERLMEIFL